MKKHLSLVLIGLFLLPEAVVVVPINILTALGSTDIWIGSMRTTGTILNNQIDQTNPTATFVKNVTVDGDITVENGTYLIENMELHVLGKITTKNNATLIVRNAKVDLSTRGDVTKRERLVFSDKSRFIAENTSILLPVSYDESLIITNDEAQANITNSNLFGWTYLLARNNSQVYLENSTLKGPKPWDGHEFGVGTDGNSKVVIENSTLNSAQANGQSSIYVTKSILQPNGVSGQGNITIEIKNSDVGYSQWLFPDSHLHISNSTVEGVAFAGSSLYIEDSNVNYDVWLTRNSTAWIERSSLWYAKAGGASTIWLINSNAREIRTQDQGNVYVGWRLPVFGTLAVPYTWIPILQGILFLTIAILLVASFVAINRRWKRRETRKRREATIVQKSEPVN